MCAELPNQSNCGCSPHPRFLQGRRGSSTLTYLQPFSAMPLVRDPPDNSIRLLILSSLLTSNCSPLILQQETLYTLLSPMNQSRIFYFLRDMHLGWAPNRLALTPVFLFAVNGFAAASTAASVPTRLHIGHIHPSPASRQPVDLTGCTAHLPKQRSWRHCNLHR